MEWISVSERLPLLNEYVLFYLNSGYVHSGLFTFINNDEEVFEVNLGWEYDYFRIGEEKDDVSHWMPIPNPPKDIKEVTDIMMDKYKDALEGLAKR